jgi:hypothetical protein
MLIADMIHSCSNDEVAQAAVASIGGRFAERVRDAAAKNGLQSGRYVSLVVRDFARRADKKTLVALSGDIAGADQPLLRGLVCVVESRLEEESAPLDDGDDHKFGSSVRWDGVALRIQ